MKYCSRYSCGRLLPEDFSGDTCPHCSLKEYSWERGSQFKELPEEAKDLEQKCHKCGSTEELKYSEPRYYGRNDEYMYGNKFECKTCDDKWKAEMARIEAMNYILINPDDDEVELLITKSDVEKYFEDFFDDYYYEGEDNPLEGYVILQVEKIDGMPKASDFNNRNVIYYDYDEWYRVEDVIEPEYEYNGEHSVNW